MSMRKTTSRRSVYVGYSWFFKAFLLFGMIAVIALFIYFNQRVVSRLRQDAARVSQAYARLIQFGASEATDPAVIDFIFENIITKVDLPMVVTDRTGTPAAWTVDVPADLSSEQTESRLREYIEEFDKEHPPIQIESEGELVSILHYGDSHLIKLLQIVPAIEISVVGIFILIAFMGFRNIQQSEQRSIWVGMAKETAHQLGTPLSSLIGWVELLKLKHEQGRIRVSGDESADFDSITTRMLGDLHRLDRVATRFGQIGSIPELEEIDINDVVGEIVSYFKLRLPAGGLLIKEGYGELPKVSGNRELLGWVVENLLKNSMEATNPRTGTVSITTSYDQVRKSVIITVQDDGRGIPPANQKKIFAPGFTTRKRGWGLGLTLAKRIVEDYHGGKIALKYSEPKIKTVFTMELPV